MLYKVREMVDSVPEPEIDPEDDMVVIRPTLNEDHFTIEQEEEGVWRVRGVRIERVAAMTYWEFDTTVRRFQRILESMGITAALEKAGITPGDMVRIGDQELEWSEG